MRLLSRLLISVLLTTWMAWTFALPSSTGQPSTPAADLSLTADRAEGATVGGPVVYLLLLSNAGPEPATAAAVQLTLPAAVRAESVSMTEGACAVEQSISCTLEEVPAGAEVAITVRGHVVAGGQAVGTALVTAESEDPVVDNNEADLEISAQGDDCTITGTGGPDELTGTNGDDVICGLGGDDTLLGLGGNDMLHGGAGADVLDGGAGADTLDGGEGRDAASFASASGGVRVDLGLGTATGQGNDVLRSVEDVRGSSFDDVLRGSNGANTLEGAAGTDLLYGRAGNDTLRGGGGDDYLEDLEGQDIFDGGAGTNTCVLGSSTVSVTSCTSPNPSDPSDTAASLDVVRVRVAKPPAWRIWTARPWRVSRLWDKGYLLVLLDTRGQRSHDYYALVRSNGRRISAVLFRNRAGDDRRIERLRVRRRSSTEVTVFVPLDRIGIARNRAYYGWRVVTLFTNKKCKRVCVDSAPDAGRMIRPVP